jgi:hypothetical protein
MFSTVSMKRSSLLNLASKSRLLSSYSFDGALNPGRFSATRWPIRKANTVFNIVPQGFKFVVERFGKLRSIEDSGWFLAIPLVDTISYVIDVRELAIDIPPQSAITRDNVAVEVSGNLFIQFIDPEKAAYGALNPLYSVTQVRNVILSKTIKDSLKSSFDPTCVCDVTKILLYPACSISHALCNWRNGTR